MGRNGSEMCEDWYPNLIKTKILPFFKLNILIKAEKNSQLSDISFSKVTEVKK